MNLLRARLPIPKDLVINFAGMIFIGCAVSLFWGEQQLSAIFTLKGLVFLILGLLTSGVIVGWPIGRLHRRFCYWLLAKSNGEMDKSNMQIVRFSGTAVMLGQLLVIYYVTRKVFYGWPIVSL